MSLLLLLKGAGGAGAPQSVEYPDLVLQWAPNAGPSTPLAATSWTSIPLSDVRDAGIRAGRAVETDDIQASTLDVTLANALRTYDPDYTGGVYYGKLKPNRRIRLLANYNGVTYPLFNGFTPYEWGQQYDPPNDSHVALSCVDGFTILQGTKLPSSWLAYEQLQDSPKAMWSLADGSVPETAVDGSGNGYDGTYQGTVSSSSALAYGGDGAAAFSAGSAIDLPDSVLLPDFVRGGVDAAVSIEGLWQYSSSTPGGIIYYQTDAGGNAGYFLGGGATGFQAAWGTTSTGFVQLTSGVNAYDGEIHHVVATFAYTQATGLVAMSLWVDGVEFTGSASPAVFAAGLHGASIVGALNRFASTFAGTLDEVAIYQSALSSARIAAHYSAATAPYDGDTTGQRINRILDLAGWPSADRNIATGSKLMGPMNLTGTALELIKVCEASEQGRFFISPDGIATFQDAYVSIGGATAAASSTISQATFGDGGGSELPYSVQGFKLKKAPVRNSVTGQRDGGAAITLTNSTSTADYGVRPWSIGSLANRNDADVRSLLQHQLQRYAQPVTISDGITIKPRTSRSAQTVTAADTFTRADSTSTLGDAESGGTWEPTVGEWGIASNTAYYVAGGARSLALLPLAADGTLQVTLSTMQDRSGVTFRAQDMDNFWRLTPIVGSATYNLVKKVSGTETTLGNTGATIPANGDAVKIVTSGSTIQCYINGVLCRTDTDTDLMLESRGGLHANSTTTTARWDDFSFTGSRTAAQLQTELWDAVLGFQMTKRYTLKRRPQTIGNTISLDVLLEGWSHRMSPMVWDSSPYFSAADARADWFILDTSVLDTGILCF